MEGGELKEFQVEIPALDQDKVIDTNGAGDSLVGGFIAGMIRGLSIQDSLKEGIELSCQIV